jgi:TonB-linked SusC/RagA family outer membrane protein
MKKTQSNYFFASDLRVKKILLTMKITTLLLLISFLQINANVNSQTTRISLKAEGASIKQVFAEIEKISDFRFLYHDGITDLNKIVSLNVSEENVTDVLNKIFSKTQSSYKILENNLVVIVPGNNYQKTNVSGQVTDAETGGPVIGANIVVKGTTLGVVTDLDGKFSIDIPDPNVTLVISSIGYTTMEVLINNQQTINVTLQPETKNLEEVVVVGYGTQKRETLTGAISTIKSKDITEIPVTNVSNSLAGKLPGVVAVTSSGEPGYDGTTLRIRGSNTFNDNSVLIVVDGVPDRSLERIDPNSIESLTVLKDASAAIYGSRAANGVILVTTKRGKVGKPDLTFTSDFGFSQPTRLPKMADAATYATLINEVEYYDNPSHGMNYAYSAEQIQKYKDGSDPWRYPNTDWFDKVLKPWSAQNSQNLTVSGGNDAMKYFVSLGTKYQDANYYNSASYYRQYDLRSNIDGKITKNISIGVDVAGRLEDRHYPIRSASDIFRGLITSYPNSVAKWPGGEPGPAIESGRNPVATSTDAAGTNNDKYYVLNTNLKLDVTIPWVKGLSFSGNLSFDQGFNFTKTFSKPFKLYSLVNLDAGGNPIINGNTYGGGTDNTPSLKEYFKSDYNKLAYGVINYQTKINDKHDIKLMVGSQVSKGNTESFSAYRDYYLSTEIQEIFAGQTTYQITDGTGSVNSRLSYFGRANYSYANKYLAEFVCRYDGSYIFPKDSRWGFFPSISLGWIVSEEDFWKNNINFINYFKLKGSWGKTGNDRVDPFQYLASYNFGYQYGKVYDKDTKYNNPFIVNSGSTLAELKTLYENVLANPDITWEVADQFDIGFSSSFLNNKFTLEADYFYYKRSNILWPKNASVPTSAGLSLPSVNYGKASNQGFDFNIGYNDKINTFGYSVSFNGGYAKNKVLKWDETPGLKDWQQTTGHPMGSGLYYQTDGIYHTQAEIDADNKVYKLGSTPAPGDVKFVDVSGDGIIDADDQVRVFKNNIPTFTFGSNINLNYKGFDLSILLQGATGANALIYSEAGKFGNYFQSFADDRWTPDNPNASGPRTFNRGNWYWAQNNNTYWLHKANYIRLKTLQIGYTLPAKAIQKAGLKSLRVYLSGYNLLTYCPDIKDFDPEIGASSTPTAGASSITGYNYPLQRVVSLGLSVGF